MKKRLDYALVDTDKLYDAVRKTNTFVRDYSMKHQVQVLWERTSQSRRSRIVEIRIGNEVWANRTKPITEVVDALIGNNQEDEIMHRELHVIDDYYGRKPLVIDTQNMNFEGRRDHVALVTIGFNTALIDIEELLKATRYA